MCPVLCPPSSAIASKTLSAEGCTYRLDIAMSCAQIRARVQTSQPDSPSRVRNVLRPTGHFVLTCEIFPSDLGVRNAAHPHSFTADRFLALFLGFKVLEHW